MLRRRARLFADIRAFFAAHDVLEVDTPALSAHATVDVHIESFFALPPGPGSRVPSPGLWLHTSPEFAMKRLLAAGSGPIYQIAHVFRAEEQGRHHNREFTMLEWYRPGFDMNDLIDEVEALLRAVGVAAAAFQRLSYREAFEQQAGFDPFAVADAELCTGLVARGLAPDTALDRDAALDLWLGAVVAPALGQDGPVFVYDYPASQAALARVDGAVAKRFELYWRGVELVNGFEELTDAAEQQRRFAADQARRHERGQPVPPFDTRLIAALAAGLPACAGVALGLDRLLMVLAGADELSAVMAFDSARA